MLIPEQQIDEITKQADIVSIISSYNVKLEHKGSRWWGRCPFHDEKTASLCITPERNLYYCFGCQAGGSVFQFVMAMESISFLEAAEKMAQILGITIDKKELNPTQIKEQEELKILLTLYQRIAKNFSLNLQKTANPARLYLEQRSISPEIIDLYALGYAPPDNKWLFRKLREQDFSANFLASSGLFSKNNPTQSLFYRRLIFPITNTSGEVIAFSGRSLNPGEKRYKYINSPETRIYKKSKELLGFVQAKKQIQKSNEFYLCEGNFDILALAQAGYKNCVAPLGTAFTVKQAEQLKRYANKACLVFDGDNAGVNATMKAAGILEELSISPAVVILDPGEDPASILAKGGKKLLQEKINKRVDFSIFMDNYLKKNYNIDSIDGTEIAFRTITPFLNRVKSPVRKELYIHRLADTLSLPVDALKKELQISVRAEKQSPAHIPLKYGTQPKQNVVLEQELLYTLLLNIDLYSEWQRKILDLELNGDISKRILTLLNDSLEHGLLNFEQLIDNMSATNSDLKIELLKRSAREDHFLNREELIRQRWLSCKISNLDKQSKEIIARIKELEHTVEDTEKTLLIDELIIEKQEIDKIIKDLKHSY